MSRQKEQTFNRNCFCLYPQLAPPRINWEIISYVATGFIERMAEPFLVLLIFSVMPLTHQSGIRQSTNCYGGSNTARFETKQGTAIPQLSAICELNGGQRTELPFDIRELLNVAGVNNNKTFLDMSVYVGCSSPILLSFTNQRNAVNKNFLLELRIGYECSVSMQNLAVWAKATYLWSLDLQGSKLSLMDSFQDNESLASNFKDIAYLTTSIIPSMFTNPKIVWPNMAVLSLESMSMKTIPSYWKTTMPHLQQLSLSFCRMKEPPEFPWNNSTLDIFHGLRWITLNLVSLPGTLLRVERNLYPRALSLDYNYIEDLSSYIFRGFSHFLDLGGNGLKAVGPSCFRNLEGLEAVDLSSNKLVSLPETLFHGLTSLRYIFLALNNLSFLKPELFQGLKNIKKIDLNDNNLKHIPKGLFSSLNKLEFLHLENNKIVSTDENPFSRHSALREVLLKNNHLSAIPSWIFRLNKIEVIDLSFNRISGLQGLTKAIKGRTPLFEMHLRHVSLNLENNNITTLGSPWQFVRIFSFFYRRFQIKLTGNPLTCDCVMSVSIKRIKPFYMFNREMRLQVYSWQCGWPRELKNKSILEVRENQWMHKEEPENCPAECVCRKRCSDKIIVVNCEGKSLADVPSSMPQGRIELNLRNNKIKGIPPYSYLINVTVLQLTNNKIDELRLPTLKKLNHTHTLLIDSNKLRSLPREVETMNFTTLALDQNLFKCDCQTKWMKHWLLKNKRRIKDVEKVLCTSGHTLGKGMFNLSDHEFICPPVKNDTFFDIEERSFLTGNILAAILGGLLLLIMIVAILLYKYHGEMKVFMFTHFDWHPFDRIDDSDPTKIYDAFISYSGDDHRWVVETLQKRLENHDPPYKLCFHHRDFRAGAPIVENILKSVDHSKRMLMVLSPSFARSGWCLLEFRAAHRKVIEDRMNYLIIILLDDVNMAELDEEIKLYMRTNTYVSYSDKWFWQKLFYAMPQQLARESMEAGNVESIKGITANENKTVETM